MSCNADRFRATSANSGDAALAMGGTCGVLNTSAGWPADVFAIGGGGLLALELGRDLDILG